MEDIMAKIKKIQEIGYLPTITPNFQVQRELALSTDHIIQLHLEAQTSLLLEILQELRKLNSPPIIKCDFASNKFDLDAEVVKHQPFIKGDSEMAVWLPPFDNDAYGKDATELPAQNSDEA